MSSHGGYKAKTKVKKRARGERRRGEGRREEVAHCFSTLHSLLPHRSQSIIINILLQLWLTYASGVIVWLQTRSTASLVCIILSSFPLLHPPPLSPVLTHCSLRFCVSFSSFLFFLLIFHTGSVCFVGPAGEALQQCLDILSTAIFQNTRICTINMRDFCTAGSAPDLFDELQVSPLI